MYNNEVASKEPPKISGKFLAPVRQKALPVRLYKCEGGDRPNGSSQGSGLRARRSDCKNGQ